MFDGSHRTNKREINYSGASSSSRTSRKANLTLARQQRLARAQAKAKLNASIVIQRCWRGVRAGQGDTTGRKGIARALDGRFQTIITNSLKTSDDYSSSSTGSSSSQQPGSVAIPASLLAFRLSPALSPFYTYSSCNKQKLGANNDNAPSVEEAMRQDLLQLEKFTHCQQSQAQNSQISSIAANRLISITLFLIRQSVSRRNMMDKEEVENRRIFSLLNYLLQSIFSFNNSNTIASDGVFVVDDLRSDRPSDYYMSILRGDKQIMQRMNPAWMINLFSSLRDYVIYHRDHNVDNEEKVMSMDVDDDGTSKNPYDLELLLKWCCKTILHLASDAVATMTSAQQLQGDEALMSSIPQYQQGIALLASILFIAPSAFCKSWLDEELTQFLRLLTTQQGGAADAVKSDTDTIIWSPIFTHYLACAITSGHNSQEPNNGHYWTTALCETLNNHECSVMHHIVIQADDVHYDQSDLYTYSVPVILQHTLQSHHDLATLATFAARGENISSWIADNKSTKYESSFADAAATAAYATAHGMDVDDDDDDDDEEEEEIEEEALRSQSVLVQQPSQRDKRAASAGRYSRQDLQTLPKLDALYQTKSLRDKKAAADRLKSLSRGKRSSQIEVQCMISLADRIGKGQWMLTLSNSLFTPTPPQLSSTPSFGLVTSSQLLLLQTRARECYPSALSSVLTSCSGSKAGRNAASPLLAKLAFHNPSLLGLWECSSQNVSLLERSLSKTANLSQLVTAYEVFSSFCDLFSHHLLAVDDDEFLQRYFSPANGTAPVVIMAGDIVLSLTKILNDLYLVNPVLAADISEIKTDAESVLRFQRARLLISGTKLWNSLHERWCRLYHNVQFCEENSWWFPFLAGQHDNNPIIHSQVTTFGDQNDDNEVMEESSVESVDVDEGDAGGDALASSFRDPKMARVLTAIPQSMPFSRRVNLFQSLIDSDKLLMQDEEATFRHMMMNLDNPDQVDGEMGGRVRVTIHRDALYSDSMETLNSLGKKLRKKIQVTFVNQHGATEAGIDGGGVFKEFLDDLIKDAFIPQTMRNESGEEEQSLVGNHPDFFSVTPLQTLQVNVDSDGDNTALSHYEFLGRVLGKAIYESILVDPQLALPFLNKLLGKQNSLDDLKNMDPEFYKHIKSLRYMSAQDIKSLGLTFETTAGQKKKTVELIPGGSNILVTKENVIQYIHLVSHQRMNITGSRQTHAFLHGFRDIIPAPWVRLFSAYEFQKLISGDDAVQGIDVQGMMNVTRYSGGLHPSQPIVQWLWEVVNEMNSDQQRKFLKFMTSCSRQPLLGFKSLAPAPCVQQTRLREDNRGVDIAEGSPIGNVRLPTSSTCMNLLKLPKYTSKEMLRDKLLYAIEAAAGFELS